MTRQHTTALAIAIAATLAAAAQTSGEILQAIRRVNDTYQANHNPYHSAFWDNAAYHTGNIEAYRLTGDAKYYLYSDSWCRHNAWSGARQHDKASWKYLTYGEDDDHVLFADWQTCFQTYLDMNELIPGSYKTERALDVMRYQCSLPQNDFWWWSDALYMAMPVLSKLFLLTGDTTYLDKLRSCFLWSDSLMWDPAAQLYYRDAKYIWPKVTTRCDGGKSFWARGDGWVLAGLAKVLADMPADYKGRDIFLTRFRQLAQGVARCQRPQGYWSRSMLCEDDAPGPETSGTAFFCYALTWGINAGILPHDDYKPVIDLAWQYLYNTALQPDSTIGYVQPIGERPDPDRQVGPESQAPFGTGAWLLAACERIRHLDLTDRTLTITITNPTDDNRCDVVELSQDSVFGRLGIAPCRQITVLDGEGDETPYQLTHDGKLLLQAFARPRATCAYHIIYGRPKDYRLYSNGRIYPDREDDLAFENDKTAWRLYGPRSKPQNVSGFDVFAKNAPEPVLDRLYQSELASYALNDRLKRQGRGAEWQTIHRNKFTYHRNHGQGMDAYTVGHTLGAGAPALLIDGHISIPDVYDQADILDNGPLRFTVRETLNTSGHGTETRLISLDKGTHLASCTVSYDSLTGPTQVCSGIILHDTDKPHTAVSKKAGYIAYADPLDSPDGQNGQLYLACLYPEKPKKLGIINDDSGRHIAGQTTIRPGQSFHYLFGAAWSRYDTPTMDVWESLLTGYARNLKSPLIVNY